MSANAAAIPSGKPIASARSERRARSRWRCTSATQSPARGPNSGPTTIAPMIRISESSMIPSAAIMVARSMKARKLTESSALSDVCCSTVSQTTASAGEPTASSSALRAARETSGRHRDERDRAVSLEPELAELPRQRGSRPRARRRRGGGHPPGAPLRREAARDSASTDGRAGRRARRPRGPAARRCGGGSPSGTVRLGQVIIVRREALPRATKR